MDPAGTAQSLQGFRVVMSFVFSNREMGPGGRPPPSYLDSLHALCHDAYISNGSNCWDGAGTADGVD